MRGTENHCGCAVQTQQAHVQQRWRKVPRDVCSNATNNWQLPGLMRPVLPVKWQLGPSVFSRALMVNAAVTQALNTRKVI